MTRLRNLVLIPLLALVLIASACGDDGVGSSPAATVNGVEISDSDFVDTLTLLNENPDFAVGLTQVPVHADGEQVDDRVDASFAAAVLELEIILELIDQEAERRGIEVTQEDSDETSAEFGAELQAFLDELPEDYADNFVRWNTQLRLIRDDLEAEIGEIEVTDEDVQAFYDENIEQFENQACVEHVLLETSEEADEVLAELEAGGDFATIAAEQSTDPSAATNGGDLGCSSPDQYVEEFAAAVDEGEIGAFLGPVETQFGFHVIRVTSRGTTPFEDAQDQIRAQLEQQALNGPAEAFGVLLDELIADADVTVSSVYGSWDDENGRVTPPEAPEGETGTLSLG